MGSFHPRHKDLYYPVNYGYVSGLLGGDGAEQDIYLLGVKSAEQEFTGKVIAVYHRYDDNETKWIVVPCDDEGIVLEDVEIPTDNEIYAQIAFQEQFFLTILKRQMRFLMEKTARLLSLELSDIMKITIYTHSAG